MEVNIFTKYVLWSKNITLILRRRPFQKFGTILLVWTIWYILSTSLVFDEIGGKSLPRTVAIKTVSDSLNADEWISTKIMDSKTKCPVVKKGKYIPNFSSKMTCDLPKLDPFHPSMIDLIKNIPMPWCASQTSYGKLVNGKIKFIDENVASATYRSIIRQGDFQYTFGMRTVVVASKKIMDEFIEVDFALKNGRHVREIFVQPVAHEHLVKQKEEKKPGIPVNVLIIGIDSLSHANALRKLPKVYELLKKGFGAFIFNGHAIVGDGTMDQLAAMLTGLGEFEQYEARRHHNNSRTIDGWSWIYKLFKEHGYITGHAADAPYIGAFQLRLLGFKDPPADFYPRPFFQVAEKIMKAGDLCINAKTISNTMFDYINEVFQVFPKKLKFLFSFNAAYSHKTYSEASMIEPDLLSFLKDFRRKGHLNNTLLIVMGDHGSRFGPARALIQGKLEERLPLFSMVFPPWFVARYPKIIKNLHTNTDRLTSWYDVYATFRHMLTFPKFPSDVKHGTSLLQEIPLSRGCADAAVPLHWCPCLEMSPISVNHSHVRNAALATVEYINTLIGEHKASANNCQILSLKSINYALLERPNDKVLSFKGTYNEGRPDFSAKSKPSHEKYCRFQIQFSTIPNNGIYEATVRYHNRWFIVSKGISRVNQYGDQSQCIAKDLPHLKKFCLCTRAI